MSMMPVVTRFDKHSGKILVAFWIFVLVAGLAALEWSLTPSNGRFRAFDNASGPGPERRLIMREWEPSTDYRFAPPPERRRYVNGGLRETYDLATDAQGLIEPALRHEKPDLTIVFMGGSTTECLYVDPENRFPYLASRTLEADLGLKINGINAARAGNNGLHSLLLLLGKVIPLRPDYVVLMEATNDIGTLSSGTYWTDTGSKRIIDVQKNSVGQSVRILTNAVLPYTSDLVSRAWRPVRNIFPRDVAQAAPSDVQTIMPRSAQERMGVEFASVLRSFIGVARAWGIEPVLMTQVNVQPTSKGEQANNFLAREQPHGAKIDTEEFGSVHDNFNAIIRDVANREHVLLIDLARAKDWSFGDVYVIYPLHRPGIKKSRRRGSGRTSRQDSSAVARERITPRR